MASERDFFLVFSDKGTEFIQEFQGFTTGLSEPYYSGCESGLHIAEKSAGSRVLGFLYIADRIGLC